MVGKLFTNYERYIWQILLSESKGTLSCLT